MKITEKTIPAIGFVAGLKIYGYVPAGEYKTLRTNGNEICLVPSSQEGHKYEGSYYWVNKSYIG